jgi:cytochrome c-type biogenesis protein CcmH
MTLFWFIAALMVAGALAWLMPILLSKHVRRDEDAVTHTDHAIASYSERLDAIEQDHSDGVLSSEQLENAKHELARELLQDVKPEDEPLRSAGSASAWVVAIVIPAISVALYQNLGEPAGIDQSGPGPQQAQSAPLAPQAGGTPSETPGSNADGMPSIEQMVTGLAARLKDNPEDGQGWLMLGRSYVVLDRMQDAEQAYGKAYALIPKNVDVLAGYAETIARNNRNSLSGRPADLLAAALAIKSDDPKTLWLAGIAAMQSGDGKNAIAHWSKLKETGALNAQETTSLDQMIAEASGAAKTQTQPATAPKVDSSAAATPTQPQTPASGTSVSIKVRVALAPELAARVAPGDALFVFARAEQGPPMPLAVARLTASVLPAEIVLDESMAMMPNMTLATFPRVVIGARISKTGNARPSNGDLQGITIGLSPKETAEVAVTISEVVGQ